MGAAVAWFKQEYPGVRIHLRKDESGFGSRVRNLIRSSLSKDIYVIKFSRKFLSFFRRNMKIILIVKKQTDKQTPENMTWMADRLLGLLGGGYKWVDYSCLRDRGLCYQITHLYAPLCTCVHLHRYDKRARSAGRSWMRSGSWIRWLHWRGMYRRRSHTAVICSTCTGGVEHWGCPCVVMCVFESVHESVCLSLCEYVFKLSTIPVTCLLYFIVGYVCDVVVKKVHVRYLISWWVSCFWCSRKI